MDEQRRAHLGKVLRRYRHRAGLTQRQLAAIAGTEPGSISHAENGSPRVALEGKVMNQLEAALALPPGSIPRFLETGDEAVFVAPTAEGEQVALRRVEDEMYRLVLRVAKQYDYETSLRVIKRLADLSREQYERESQARESGAEGA